MNMEGRHQGRRLAYQIKIQRGYITHLDLGKGRDASEGTRREKKQTTHDFSDIRAAIGIHNANALHIASALVGDHQLIDSHRIPTKTDVKRERSSLKRAFNHLQTSHECRGRRVENIMLEKRFLLARINDDKN